MVRGTPNSSVSRIFIHSQRANILIDASQLKERIVKALRCDSRRHDQNGDESARPYADSEFN